MHAERFWLPYLWGIDPAEYAILLDICESAAQLEELGPIRKLAIVEDELLEYPWRWAGCPLKDLIEDLVQQHRRNINMGESTDDLVGRILHVFWQTVEKARAARATPHPSKDWVTLLHPRRALAFAVDQILSSP